MPVETRPLPPQTVDGLRPPRSGFPYFAHADRFPFDAGTTQYSAVNAWWLADACLLVYGDKIFIEDAFGRSPLPNQSWQLAWLGTGEDNRGMVLSRHEAIVVVFRGTRLDVHSPFDAAEIVLINQDDLWTNSQFLPTMHKGGGRVHSGFLQAFAEVSTCLSDIVNTKRPGQHLYLTGHSLGAALATLAAAHIGPPHVHGLYTYGSPRVGDAAFVEGLSAVSHFRIVYGEDWVATVPPELLGYAHAGILLRVPGGTTHDFWTDLVNSTGDLLAALNVMAEQLRVTVGELPFRISGLVDHAPICYATLLWNALLASSRKRQD